MLYSSISGYMSSNLNTSRIYSKIFIIILTPIMFYISVWELNVLGEFCPFGINIFMHLLWIFIFLLISIIFSTIYLLIIQFWDQNVFYKPEISITMHHFEIINPFILNLINLNIINIYCYYYPIYKAWVCMQKTIAYILSNLQIITPS